MFNFDISKYSYLELMEIYDDLQVLKWNYLLGKKPITYDNMSNKDKYEFLKPIMNPIQQLKSKNEQVKLNRLLARYDLRRERGR